MTPTVEIHVELDLVSGRPNPTWALQGPPAIELLRRLDAVGGPSPVPAEAPDRLGYRGFVLSIEDKGVKRTWRVGDGVVRTRGKAYADPGGRIEQGLIAATPAEFRKLIP